MSYKVESAQPVVRDEWVVLLGLVDEAFTHLRSSGSSANIFILFLGYELSLVEEGSSSTWDPIWEVVYLPWVLVVHFGTYILSAKQFARTLRDS
jgi:hypothetical protein